ncbi:MAG: hypothetical protein RLZZ163_1337 [Actinomycetota bacterium]|jgi:hypothetical protein
MYAAVALSGGKPVTVDSSQGPATLLVGFNRPDLLERLLDAVLLARPARLYIAVDGPRSSQSSDVALVERSVALARRAATLHGAQLRIRTENLGCRSGMVDAIDWFFSNESEGVILEDDCIPGIDFFRFAQELLARYRHDERVTTISGHGALRALGLPSDAYSFVRTPMIWGWATWRRAWAQLDRNGSAWKELRDSPWLRYRGKGHRDFERHWHSAFEGAESGAIDSWAYGWTFSSWLHDSLTIVPHRNLVANVGFRPDATHTYAEGPSWVGTTEAITFPLRHPGAVAVNERLERFLQRNSFGVQRSPLDARRLRAELRRFGALVISETAFGRSWLERRRAVLRSRRVT